MGSRSRATAPWGLVRKCGPGADLPQREEKSAAPALSSAGLGAALAIFDLAHRSFSPDLKLHMHAAVDAVRALRAIKVCGRRAAMCMPVPNPALRGAAGLRAPMKFPNAIGLGSMLRKAQVVRHRLAILCACWIVLGLRAPGPAKSSKRKRDGDAGGHGFSS